MVGGHDEFRTPPNRTSLIDGLDTPFVPSSSVGDAARSSDAADSQVTPAAATPVPVTPAADGHSRSGDAADGHSRSGDAGDGHARGGDAGVQEPIRWEHTEGSLGGGVPMSSVRARK
jgi:hypothetical protein